jgi:pyruvate/2-oxoglutarate dehydrogenase complex dihydrolipoamide dehydrogenase (E3) component
MTHAEASTKTQTLQDPHIEEFDIVILGGGTGSTIAAWTFAGEGQRVAVIDRKYIGGSCPNIACLPSKNIIHSAKVASYVRQSEDFGIAKRDFTVDMCAVRTRKRNMVKALNDVYLENYQKTGAELIFGSGRFVAPKTIEVTLGDGKTRRLRGTNVIVSTGTHAAMGLIPGLAEAQPLTHIEALELDRVPEHLIVIGAGYIGLEFSQAMRRFGSRVTMIEQGDRLLSREDQDVSATLRELFVDDGIELMMNATVKRVSGKSGESVEIIIEKNGETKTLKGTDLLLALGRVPNTADIGLQAAGIEVTDTGYLKVNERLQTTAPGVWAIGEVAGSPLFTHVSIDDFRVVHSSITGGTRVTTGRVVPFCLFTDPEFARVGLSEKEAKARGLGYRLFKVPMDANLRARTLGETRGFMKALVELDSDRLLGFTIIGVGAGEIMTAVQVAMIASQRYTLLRDAILAHPTLVEGLEALFTSVPSTHRAVQGTAVSA